MSNLTYLIDHALVDGAKNVWREIQITCTNKYRP